MNTTCETCRFWSPTFPLGTCYRFPPVVQPDGKQTRPHTAANDQCGEYRRAEAVAAAPKPHDPARLGVWAKPDGKTQVTPVGIYQPGAFDENGFRLLRYLDE